MMKGYCDIEDIENYLLEAIESGFEPQIEEWIEAMENYVDKETGRNFIADGSTSTRKFDGDGDDEILIDDCVAITELKIDDEVITDYFSYPANSLPKTTLKLDDQKFTRGNQNVEVTAKWGYSVAVPADIRLAMTILVSGIIYQSLSQEGEVQSMTMGRYSVTYKTEKEWQDFESIKATLDKYKKFNF
jgi:hypothetical protein